MLLVLCVHSIFFLENQTKPKQQKASVQTLAVTPFIYFSIIINYTHAFKSKWNYRFECLQHVSDMFEPVEMANEERTAYNCESSKNWSTACSRECGIFLFIG